MKALTVFMRLTSLASEGGKAFAQFVSIVEKFIEEHSDISDNSEIGFAPLTSALSDLKAAAQYFATEGPSDPNASLCGSYDFMHMFGYVTLGYLWARQVVAAEAALNDGTSDKRFLRAKLKTAKFYMLRQLPKTSALLERIKSGSDPIMSMAAEEF